MPDIPVFHRLPSAFSALPTRRSVRAFRRGRTTARRKRRTGKGPHADAKRARCDTGPARERLRRETTRRWQPERRFHDGAADRASGTRTGDGAGHARYACDTRTSVLRGARSRTGRKAGSPARADRRTTDPTKWGLAAMPVPIFVWACSLARTWDDINALIVRRRCRAANSDRRDSRCRRRGPARSRLRASRARPSGYSGRRHASCRYD